MTKKELLKILEELPDGDEVYMDETDEYEYIPTMISFCNKHKGYFDEDAFKKHYDCQDEIPFQRITIECKVWQEFIEKLKKL